MKHYNKAKELFDMDAVEFTGGVSEEVIQKAERTLNLTFPESYRSFLKEFGAGDVGGEVVFGLLENERENSDLDMLKITQVEHDYKMPKHMVVIFYNAFDDCLYCLDTSRMIEGECPMMRVSSDYADIEEVAESFGEFLLDLVEE